MKATHLYLFNCIQKLFAKPNMVYKKSIKVAFIVRERNWTSKLPSVLLEGHCPSNKKWVQYQRMIQINSKCSNQTKLSLDWTLCLIFSFSDKYYQAITSQNLSSSNSRNSRKILLYFVHNMLSWFLTHTKQLMFEEFTLELLLWPNYNILYLIVNFWSFPLKKRVNRCHYPVNSTYNL